MTIRPQSMSLTKTLYSEKLTCILSSIVLRAKTTLSVDVGGLLMKAFFFLTVIQSHCRQGGIVIIY